MLSGEHLAEVFRPMNDSPNRDIVFELTTSLISLSLVFSGIVVVVVQALHGQQASSLPEWQSLGIGTVLGYYLNRSSSTRGTAATHVHDAPSSKPVGTP